MFGITGAGAQAVPKRLSPRSGQSIQLIEQRWRLQGYEMAALSHFIPQQQNHNFDGIVVFLVFDYHAPQ